MSVEAHESLRSMLGFYLASGLDPTEEAEVSAHLESCEGCRTSLDELAPVVDLLVRHPLSDGLPEAAGGSGRRRPVRGHGRAGWVAGGVAGVAAAAAGVVLAVGGGTGSPVRLLYPVAGRAGTGSVVLEARPWGTQLTLRLEHLPPAAAYVAWVTGPSGPVAVGDWGATRSRSAVVELATAVHPAELRQVVVTTAAGAVVLRSSAGGPS